MTAASRDLPSDRLGVVEGNVGETARAEPEWLEPARVAGGQGEPAETVVPPRAATILGRAVTARASRSARSTDSVPEGVNTA